MIYLWQWTMALFAATAAAKSSMLWISRIGKTVALSNLAYSAIHLFGILIPVAGLRYMRAHFLGVEAQQVTLRPGMGEETLGLIP